MSEAMTLERTFVLQKTLLENRMELSNCQVYRIMKKQILITKTKYDNFEQNFQIILACDYI